MRCLNWWVCFAYSQQLFHNRTANGKDPPQNAVATMLLARCVQNKVPQHLWVQTKMLTIWIWMPFNPNGKSLEIRQNEVKHNRECETHIETGQEDVWELTVYSQVKSKMVEHQKDVLSRTNILQKSFVSANCLTAGKREPNLYERYEFIRRGCRRKFSYGQLHQTVG